MGILGVQGGTGVRIATASVRTGFAMTGSFTGGAVGGPSGTPAPTEAYLVVRRGGALLPTVVPTDSRALSCPPIGALPRNRLASSATGGASPISPPAGDRKGRPYESVTWGATGGRPQGSPLRKGYMGCGTKSAGGVEPRPYEGLQEVTACGGGLLRCIRGAFCSARRYYGPPGPRFGPGRDRR